MRILHITIECEHSENLIINQNQNIKTLKYAQRSKAIALYAAVLNSTSNSMHTAFNDFEEYCDNLCDWYNIYDKEQLKADIEDAYHSQEITN